MKKTKFYLLQIVQLSLFILIAGYLSYKTTFADKGIIQYTQLKEKYNSNIIAMKFAEKEFKILETKLSLLNENAVNLMYLEELSRLELNYGKSDEKMIML